MFTLDGRDDNVVPLPSLEKAANYPAIVVFLSPKNILKEDFFWVSDMFLRLAGYYKCS